MFGSCFACEGRRLARLVHREFVILGLLVCLTGIALVATRAMAHSNESLRRGQAATWFTQAERASNRGETDVAVVALRRAVSREPGSRRYRLALARALIAGGRRSEAERVLLALREADPEDPEANLSLARLEARGPDTDAARRYYQYALAGLWRPEQALDRQAVRFELVDFLLARDERARALSELLLVPDHLPSDAALYARVGRMFLAAGDARASLDRFVRALQFNPSSPDALAGAGEAAFVLGDYARALRYLAQAPDSTGRLVSLRDTARLVLEADPLAARLGATERLRRLRTLLGHVTERLKACAGSDSAPALAAELAKLREAVERPQRASVRDVVDDGLEVAFRIEYSTDQTCEVRPTSADRAVVLIARRHGLGDQ